MGLPKSVTALALITLLSVTFTPPEAKAGGLGGFAGAAFGFALGAMAAGQRPVYYGPRYRRTAVHRNRPSARSHYASSSMRRRSGSGSNGIAVNASSDPFAGASGAKPIPVSGN